MRYIGLMSGTSVDSIDAVVIAIGSTAGFELIAALQHPIPPDTRRRLHSLMQSGTDELDRAAQLDIELGQLFAQAAIRVREQTGLARKDIRAIGSHGQTLRHAPAGPYPYSIQIGDPSVIAELTGISTVADFRARDIAAGGQGAPLVPAFHRWLFQKKGTCRAIINLGGIANLTYLPADPVQDVIGYDIGPANTLLDRWVERHLGKAYDHDGAWGSGGTVLADLLQLMLNDPYFTQPAPKSTGRDYFNLEWLDTRLRLAGGEYAPQDVQTTLVELTALSISRELSRQDGIEEIYLCGGGACNSALVEAIRRQVGNIPLATTDAIGLNPNYVEAAAFAWLAHQTLEGKSGNLPSVTGAARPVILGGLYQAGMKSGD